MAEETQAEIGIQLGDKIYISGGLKDGLRGRIYYLDETMIKILPDGVQHRLEELPVVDGDLEESLEITGLYVLKKRAAESFVEQNDFQVGYLLETIRQDGSAGPTYTIQSINEAEDSVILMDETGAQKQIVFGFVGIPQDEDFVIGRVRQPPESLRENNAANAAEHTEDEEIVLLDSIEVPEIYEIREIPKAQRFFPDVVQRSDMLQDLLSMLDIKKQKNPEKQSELRKLVEQMMILRNQVVEYSKSGEPLRPVSPSSSTLMELLTKHPVPLSRPVVDAKRVVYLDHTITGLQNLLKGAPDGDDRDSAYENVILQYLSDTIAASNEYLERIAGVQGTQVNPDILPNWYLGWDGYYKKYMASWEPETKGRAKPFLRDSEFFRTPPPDITTPFTEGIPKTGRSEKDVFDSSVIGNSLKLSYLRGLGARLGRLRDKEAARVIEPAELAPIVSYLLFPLKYEIEMGAIRSGSLAIDMGKSQTRPLSLLRILELEGGISDVPAAGSILSLGNTSIGNIGIEDWLAAQPIEAKGIADILHKLASYGLANIEFTVDQMDVLIKKIDRYRALIYDTIAKTRSEAKAAYEALTLQNRTFLDPVVFQERVAQLLADREFQKLVPEFQNRFPSYRENDIALFSYLYNRLFDFTVARLSTNQEGYIREFRRVERELFLKRVKDSARAEDKKKSAGEVPNPNPCPHVRSLLMIRKVQDTGNQMKLLAKFISQYGGEKRDNWLKCQVCSQNCLCHHEVLLLHEFLRPREKDAIHKDLLLAFSYGQFHGKYICKNCGQGISTIEYDTSLEFDDEGRPMMGRSVLVDEDAILEDKIESLLGAPAESTKPIVFSTEQQQIAYQVLKQVVDRLGIQVTETSYRTIVNRIENEILKLQSRIDYEKMQKAQKARGVAIPDYDVYINRRLVLLVGAYLLIEIQTNIPGYTVRYKLPGCKPGFSGFPIGKDTDMTGLTYVACAIAGIQKNEAPWNLTGFLKEKSEAKRTEGIAKLMTERVKELITNSEIQRDLEMKKEYFEKTTGEQSFDEGLVETVPPGFTPEQVSPTAEKGAPVAEAANEREKARAWILQANDFAKESVFMGATCCYHPLSEPLKYWQSKEKELVPLPGPAAPQGMKKSNLVVHFKPRRLDTPRVVAKEDLYYRIFLKLCYDRANPERYGLPHEPGYDNRCPHCGLSFPKSWDLVSLEEGKLALETQNVDTSQEAFQSLLDESHRKYSARMSAAIVPVRSTALLQKLLELSPSPFESWRPLLAELITNIQTLPENKPVDEIEIAAMYGSLSNMAEAFKQELVARLGQANAEVLEQLASQPPYSLVESLRTYFFLSFQRGLLKYSVTPKVQVSYNLGPGTVEDIEKVLTNHLLYISTIVEKLASGRTRAKILYAKNQLGVLLPLLKNHVRAPLLPGGSIGLPYMVKAAILGIFAELVDPNRIPPGVEFEEAGIADNARGTMEILKLCITQYSSEGLNYTPAQIKAMMARRDEIEKMRIITRLDRMSPDEKRVELINKRLGLGDWAIGGTKLIYAYDKDQYERERLERSEMENFAATVEGGGEEPVVPAGRPADGAGLYNFGEEAYGENSGYDIQPPAAADDGDEEPMDRTYCA